MIFVHLLALEPVEDDHLVEPVQELRTERLAHVLHHRALDELALVLRREVALLDGLDVLRADVAREDDDGVLEVHGAPLAVGEATVVEHLEQHVVDVGVGLLDLVEEDDRVRAGAEPAR